MTSICAWSWTPSCTCACHLTSAILLLPAFTLTMVTKPSVIVKEKRYTVLGTGLAFIQGCHLALVLLQKEAHLKWADWGALSPLSPLPPPPAARVTPLVPCVTLYYNLLSPCLLPGETVSSRARLSLGLTETPLGVWPQEMAVIDPITFSLKLELGKKGEYLELEFTLQIYLFWKIGGLLKYCPLSPNIWIYNLKLPYWGLLAFINILAILKIEFGGHFPKYPSRHMLFYQFFTHSN